MSTANTRPHPVEPATAASPTDNAGLPFGTDSASPAANSNATAAASALGAELDALHISPKREGSPEAADEDDKTENPPLDANRSPPPQAAPPTAAFVPAAAGATTANSGSPAPQSTTANPPPGVARAPEGPLAGASPTSLRLATAGVAGRPPPAVLGAPGAPPSMRSPHGPVAGVRPPAGRGMAGPMGMRPPMGGPMGMGGRGAQVPVQTRLPPSLQAKMDKVREMQQAQLMATARCTTFGGAQPYG